MRDIVRTGFKIGLCMSSASQSSGVGFHNRDSTYQALAALTLLFQFLGERANLVLEIILLDCSAGDERVLSLPLQVREFQRWPDGVWRRTRKLPPPSPDNLIGVSLFDEE